MINNLVTINDLENLNVKIETGVDKNGEVVKTGDCVIKKSIFKDTNWYFKSFAEKRALERAGIKEKIVTMEIVEIRQVMFSKTQLILSLVSRTSSTGSFGNYYSIEKEPVFKLKDDWQLLEKRS